MTSMSLNYGGEGRERERERERESLMDLFVSGTESHTKRGIPQVVASPNGKDTKAPDSEYSTHRAQIEDYIIILSQRVDRS